MADGPAVFTIPPHVAFVDALAKGLIERTRGDPMRLARALVLLPNRRAVRALTEAFVRLSDGGALLLPRMTPIGDVDEDEALGSFADDIEAEAAMLPAVDPYERRLLLTRIVRRWSPGLNAVEAMRLAVALERTLDGLGREGQGADQLLALPPDELAEHWQRTLEFLQLLTREWPSVLQSLGKADRVPRANALIAALTERWRRSPTDRLVVAAGIVDTSPCVGAFAGVIARLPDGLVVLPGLDTAMAEERWREIRCHLDEEDGHPRGDSESHPQFAFRCLLSRMKVGRGDVESWPWASDSDGPVARTGAIARAMAPARFTDDWAESAVPAEALNGVRLLEAATPGEEAQAIALTLRRQIDTPGKTAALVTPDRALARRVAAHLARYEIPIDDSAGVSLRVSPPGTLVLALTDAAAQDFAPTALLAAFKHPLVSPAGIEQRRGWLDAVRALDLALRGVRPAPGLDGIGAKILDAVNDRYEPADPAVLDWWEDVHPLLQPLEGRMARPMSLGALFETLRTVGVALAGDELWRGPAGRALSDLFTAMAANGETLTDIAPADAPGLVGAFLQDIAVRAPGRHPRLSIYGLLEARLQRADLMILGGLNEGMWPALPSPDPWLAPSARSGLGLPGLERRVGLSAHDFVQAIGAPEVLLTRARRDDSAPTVPSRFWLRLSALAGDALESDHETVGIARAIDGSTGVRRPAPQPKPAPPAELRPRRISVTAADRLKADPYSFYADKMLGLRALSPLDEDPNAADKGTFIHKILQDWIGQHGGDLDRLAGHAAIRLREWDRHPLMRALWAPRVERMIDWVIEAMRGWSAAGWTPLAAEAEGVLPFGSVTLSGNADRIDRRADGTLAIVDYKTGGVPSKRQIETRFALQLGLLAHMAERGAFGEAAPVSAVRYWKLSGGITEGFARDPLLDRGKPWIDAAGFIEASRRELQILIDTLLLGDAPFTAKLHPEHATRYTDYDHVARVAEWWGRREAAE